MNRKQYILYIVVIVCCWGATARASTPLDSIRIENQGGKKVIVHLVEAKETYYALGRKYGVAPKTIMAYNKNRALQVNDIIKIPTEQPYKSETAPMSIAQAPQTRTPNQQGAIKYKVGRGETLYSIAKRFGVTEAQIMAANSMTQKSLKAGQVLQIPQETSPAPTPQSEPELPLEEPEEEELVIEQNRYGIRQMNEKGIGIWLEGLNADGGKMLALHKTAPVGTVVKITNPMTQRSTFAKVVGKYTDTSQTRDAIIVISKAAANQIGILDKRFLVNISYGVPEN